MATLAAVAAFVIGCGEQSSEDLVTDEEDPNAAADSIVTVQSPVFAPGYLGVWQSGTGAQYWRAGMTDGEFVQADQGFFNKGYRMTSVDVYDYTESCGTLCTTTAYRYAAVWEPGRPPAATTTGSLRA